MVLDDPASHPRRAWGFCSTSVAESLLEIRISGVAPLTRMGIRSISSVAPGDPRSLRRTPDAHGDSQCLCRRAAPGDSHFMRRTPDAHGDSQCMSRTPDSHGELHFITRTWYLTFLSRWSVYVQCSWPVPSTPNTECLEIVVAFARRLRAIWTHK